jgi:integrase/recombinase XerD
MWGQWLRAGGAADKTITTRLAGVQSMCGHAGGVHPAELTTTQIVAWLAGCSSRWTRRTYATTARLWHAWLVAQGIREDDPTTLIPRQPQPRGKPRPAADKAISDALGTRRLTRTTRAYILLAAYEGLRVHEIAKLRGEDFDDGWLHVAGKGDTQATLPVHPVVAELRRGFPETGWWFPGSDGGHVSGAAVSRAVSDAFTRAGHHVTAHQLRHWFGTHLQRSTGDLRITQELMRHVSIQSTAIYTQVSTRSKVDAMRRLGTVAPDATRRSAGPGQGGRPDTRPRR